MNKPIRFEPLDILEFRRYNSKIKRTWRNKSLPRFGQRGKRSERRVSGSTVFNAKTVRQCMPQCGRINKVYNTGQELFASGR